MHRFFADFLDENSAVLNEEEAAHALKVLRLRQGDACQALMDGSVYEATISQIQPQVILQLGEKLPSPEPSIRVTLYQGLPKGDKMDFLSQKCTEAGIFRIVPVLFSRCVVKWEKKDDEKKLPRWQRIAAEAAKQSGRAIVPEIGRPVTLKQLCEELKEYDLALVPWEDQKGNGIRQQFAGQKNIAVVIGPEGGMAPEEIEMMRQSGARPVTLGPRIFRTETAGLAALISLMTLSGDME
ncbi:MAG: 16S rRNA (uracil(1498)-N(3))-methyltransferase [Clostridia bacterium]|nr:16S rRNA (uracil(1498)-N(3))-methyltransferase [Clostridia bacterium]MBQ6804754.1 16S rRNA (uracil(1498)-N(3))-methyltransferase [Clostridia bacterium]